MARPVSLAVIVRALKPGEVAVVFVPGFGWVGVRRRPREGST